MEIKRDVYLKKLVSFMWSEQVKVITGIRKRWYDDHGVLNIGILDFLLDDTII